MLFRPFAASADNASAPFCAVRGEGYWLVDAAGNRLLDGVSGMWHVPLGYSCAALNETLMRQAAMLPAASLFTISTDVALGAAEAITARLGLSGWRVFFFNSGVEAIEGAAHLVELIARAEGSAAAIGGLPGGFHGNSAYVRALPRALPQADTAPGVLRAIVFEPVQGVAGVRPLTDATVSRLREAQRDGTILISDEVGCGLFRLGVPVSARGFGIDPDIIVVSKGLTNGYAALSAVVLAPAVMARLRDGTWDDGRTTAGTALGCALATTALALLEQSPGRSAERHARLATLAERLAARVGGTARAIGLLAAVELPLEAPIDVVDRKAANACFIANGVLNRIAADGLSITIAPGFDLDDEAFEQLEDGITDTIDQLLVQFGRPRRSAA
jgi:4-aminobutyrate--pyruvate transaminase